MRQLHAVEEQMIIEGKYNEYNAMTSRGPDLRWADTCCVHFSQCGTVRTHVGSDLEWVSLGQSIPGGITSMNVSDWGKLGGLGQGLATDDSDDRLQRTHQRTFSKRSGFLGDIGKIGTGTGQ